MRHLQRILIQYVALLWIALSLEGPAIAAHALHGRAPGLMAEAFSSTAQLRPHVHRGCVHASHGSLTFSHTQCQGSVARGAYVLGTHTPSGMAQLAITTAGGHPDELQMRAAGYLEGYLSADQIHAHHHNLGAFFNQTSQAPTNWLLSQHAWAAQRAAVGSRDPIWRALRLVLCQLEGMVEGYAQRREAQHAGHGGSPEAGAQPLPSLGLRDFLFMSAVGDFSDVVAATVRQAGVDWDSLSPAQLANQLGTSGKCSALVRVTGDFSQLLMAHSAWYTYGALVKVYKHFDFQLADPAMRLSGMSFSSYPGELSSDDDFYLLDTGLVVLQTTNSVFNASLYDSLTPQSLLSWQRARVASFLAASGQEWVAHMQRHNSGTGNNQWMVVDLNLFSPGKELPPGLLWVVEQAPGLMEASDVTDTLARGYWPSYNVPFHPSLYSWMGYPEFVAQQEARGEAYGEAVSGVRYQLCPRAKIFRRDVGGISDLDSLQAFMRSNGWPADPYSGGSPLGAICGRGDLDPSQPRPYGCIDTKVTNHSMAARREAFAVNGPTTAGGALPAFQWRGSAAEGTAHMGQPQRYDYRFELMTKADDAWGASPAAPSLLE